MFSSTRALTKAIDSFTEIWNKTCEPFEWTATADDINERLDPSQPVCGGLPKLPRSAPPRRPVRRKVGHIYQR